MAVPERLMVGCAVVFCIVKTSDAPLSVTVVVFKEEVPEHVREVAVVVAREVAPETVRAEAVVVAREVAPVIVTVDTDDKGRYTVVVPVMFTVTRLAVPEQVIPPVVVVPDIVALLPDIAPEADREAHVIASDTVTSFPTFRFPVTVASDDVTDVDDKVSTVRSETERELAEAESKLPDIIPDSVFSEPA